MFAIGYHTEPEILDIHPVVLTVGYDVSDHQLDWLSADINRILMLMSFTKTIVVLNR
jgi:hypothetical protein